MARRRAWTKREDEIIRRNAGLLTVSDLALILPNRSETSVRSRILALSRESQIKTVKVSSKPRRIGAGTAPDLGKTVYRSGWERNFARVLKLNKIKWEYESKLFEFDRPKNSAVAYLPDFHILDYEGEEIWVEVKGRVMPGTFSKLMGFKENYPEEFAKLYAICEKGTKADKFFKRLGIPILMYYQDMRKEYKDRIPTWEGQ